jgi:ADP-heptose:LPS heptosyltransferase
VGEYIVIHPGSRGSASTYRPEQYAAVAEALLADRADISVVVTAGPGEERLARQVVEGVRHADRIGVVEELSLDGLSELLRGAAGFLGSSSGPAHLAALVETPVVALYPGLPPMWPARWRPLGEHVTTLVPHPEEPLCDECGKKHQPENCAKRIAAQRVIDACRDMLVGRDAGSSDYIS